MLDLCLVAYKAYTDQLQIESEEEADLIAYPLKYQMWHHTFKPHEQVPQIELASLAPPPTMVRSSTVNDFLHKTSLPSLMQTAMNKIDEAAEEEIKQDNDEEKTAHEQKL